MVSPLQSRLSQTRVSVSRPTPVSQRVSTTYQKSLARPFAETVSRSPIRVSRRRADCACKSSQMKREYQEVEVERKHCPMCNSLLIKKSLSPIRKSVENRLKNLDTFGETAKSVSLDTVLRASARNQLFEQNMVRSPPQ